MPGSQLCRCNPFRGRFAGRNLAPSVAARELAALHDAVTVVRDQAQALLNSVNQLIGVVNEPEIQQALIDVRDGLQRVVDQFNQTGMRDIDSLIEIVGELRDITDKLTAALQELQGRLGTSDGSVSDLADELEVSSSLPRPPMPTSPSRASAT